MSEPNLKDINELITTEFAKTVEMFGLTPSEARLFAILYLEGEPMTLDEMGEALGKSKTSMSTGIRSLLELNLVERVWKKGERKDLYRADENLYKKFMNAFIHKWMDATNRQKHSLEQIETVLSQNGSNLPGAADPKEVNDLNARLKDMIAFHQLLETAFKKIKPANSVSIDQKLNS
ncbi:GbsR/MarR family transcriptional regulator [Sediminibacillus albus]|uniref:HTH-type transcriptional regulator n=1 Tax=Sediminibacillus albus TaxID=407036 RepID=A0A1G8XEG8_9BACI|nr:MarR family transcriptional regulator [Sediminibacillus albus]SDJ88816.1 DNA-binding transcriptional regulator GbsR, MarR family [Sediminibacillus albus]